MIIFYCGFDEEKTMKFAAAFGIRAEFEYRFYDSKDACVKRHPFMLSVDSTNYSLKKLMIVVIFHRTIFRLMMFCRCSIMYL